MESACFAWCIFRAVIKLVREAAPNTKILMLSAYGEDKFVLQAMEAGAHGYLLKDVSRESLLQAIRYVHEGKAVLDPSVTGLVVDRMAKLSHHVRRSRSFGLTDREIDLLASISEGLSNKEIADELCISESSVKKGLASLYNKLGVRTRAEAISKAYSLSLISN